MLTMEEDHAEGELKGGKQGVRIARDTEQVGNYSFT